MKPPHANLIEPRSQDAAFLLLEHGNRRSLKAAFDDGLVVPIFAEVLNSLEAIGGGPLIPAAGEPVEAFDRRPDGDLPGDP
jgi:hypothetical protein